MKPRADMTRMFMSSSKVPRPVPRPSRALQSGMIGMMGDSMMEQSTMARHGKMMSKMEAIGEPASMSLLRR